MTTTIIRIIQKSSSKKSMIINLPKDEIGWDIGDAVKIDKVDDNTITLKRLREWACQKLI